MHRVIFFSGNAQRMEEAERRANMQEDNDEEDEEEEAKAQDEDDDEDCIPVRTEIDENIPLTKPGYEPMPVTTFPPIKVPHLQPSPCTIFVTVAGIWFAIAGPSCTLCSLACQQTCL